MSNRSDWSQIKRNRPQNEARRRGYEEASQAVALGERIRHLREEAELTQAQLAARMGTTQPTVARLEAGGVTPSLSTLSRVASALSAELVVELRPTR